MELPDVFLATLRDRPWALLAARLGLLAAAVWLSDVIARFVLVRVTGLPGALVLVVRGVASAYVRVFQEPAGSDVRRALREVTAGQGG